MFVIVTREKKADLERKQSGRCVFECRVFGQKGVGKVDIHFACLYFVTLKAEHLKDLVSG